MKLAPGDDPVAPLKTLLDSGMRFLIVDCLRMSSSSSPTPRAPRTRWCSTPARPTSACARRIAAPTSSTSRRRARCSPTRSPQYLIWKQWRKWLLVVGSHPEDVALGEAYERAAKKFGAKIVEKRTFEDTGGGRRSDSGVVQTQRQMPVFTQKRARLRRARSPPTRTRCSPAICPIAPGTRGRSSGSGGLQAHELGPLARALGRRAAAEPVRAHVPARG